MHRITPIYEVPWWQTLYKHKAGQQEPLKVCQIPIPKKGHVQVGHKEAGTIMSLIRAHWLAICLISVNTRGSSHTQKDTETMPWRKKRNHCSIYLHPSLGHFHHETYAGANSCGRLSNIGRLTDLTSKNWTSVRMRNPLQISLSIHSMHITSNFTKHSPEVYMFAAKKNVAK